MKSKKRSPIRISLIVLLAGIICVSGYKIGEKLLSDKQAKDYFEQLAETVAAAEGADGAAPVKAGQALPQYAELYRRNPDLFGWIRIDDTPINYPVMFTPRDSQYYLHRDFDGNEFSSGLPFVDGACPADGNFYLIYGHHMKNKSMFGTLPLYADEQYMKKHAMIYFDTLYEKRSYQVMAAFYGKIYDDSVTGVFKYYEYRDLSDPEIFSEYITKVKNISVYDTGINAEYGDDIITLSTCNYHTDNGRFVVVAKRIA